MLIAAKDKEEIRRVKAQLNREFEKKDFRSNKEDFWNGDSQI